MAGVGVGLAASGASGISLTALRSLGFVVGLVLMLPGHALGATGAGDVKLMAAVGAIVGPVLVVSALLFTAIAGGVLAVAVAIRRQTAGRDAGRNGPADRGAGRREKGNRGRRQRSSRFAYGPAIAVGSMLAALIG